MMMMMTTTMTTVMGSMTATFKLTRLIRVRTILQHAVTTCAL